MVNIPIEKKIFSCKKKTCTFPNIKILKGSDPATLIPCMHSMYIYDERNREENLVRYCIYTDIQINKFIVVAINILLYMRNHFNIVQDKDNVIIPPFILVLKI